MKKALLLAAPGNGREWVDSKGLLAELPICHGTLDNWRKAGLIPHVRLGKRRVIFHIPSVRESLLRMQRGGGL